MLGMIHVFSTRIAAYYGIAVQQVLQGVVGD
jgi:hypothetical protein